MARDERPVCVWRITFPPTILPSSLDSGAECIVKRGWLHGRGSTRLTLRPLTPSLAQGCAQDGSVHRARARDRQRCARRGGGDSRADGNRGPTRSHRSARPPRGDGRNGRDGRDRACRHRCWGYRPSRADRRHWPCWLGGSHRSDGGDRCNRCRDYRTNGGYRRHRSNRADRSDWITESTGTITLTPPLRALSVSQFAARKTAAAW